MGIEPTSDSDCRSTVLKTAPPTRTDTPPPLKLPAEATSSVERGTHRAQQRICLSVRSALDMALVDRPDDLRAKTALLRPRALRRHRTLVLVRDVGAVLRSGRLSE